jgi:hypothetical protein
MLHYIQKTRYLDQALVKYKLFRNTVSKET